jgi:5-methylthioadenosine/S-adenosylhomocysteine deaminase
LEKVDIILSGGTIVTMNDTFDVIPDGAIAVNRTHIIALGPAQAISKQYETDDVVDCRGHYILPGLVNAHTHVPMTLLRGLADDLRLDVWLLGYIMPTEREFVNPEFCRLGTRLACAEMIRSGVTSFADMYYFEADVATATVEAGLRAVLGETVLKFPSPDAETYEDSLKYARDFLDQWREHPLITAAVAPHAPYSNTEEILRECVELAMEYDAPLIIHLAETRREVDDNIREHDEAVIQWMESIDLFQSKVLAAHCVHIDEMEIRILREHGVHVAHCPSANLKLASGIAPVSQMLASGVTVGIGTDGPASNNDLDMFEEMRLAALLAKTAANDPTALPARQALLLATRQGAASLFLDDVTGSLEVGKQADVIVMDSRPVHNTPRFDFNPDAVYSQIVYAGKSADVTHVICSGRWLMRDRQVLTVDEAALRQQASEYAVRVGAFLGAHEEDPLSKLLAVSVGLERGESFEVQSKALLHDESAIEELLSHQDIEVLRSVHYRQYDTYFQFGDPARGRVRYREDDAIDAHGAVVSVRSRLTYTEPAKERDFDSTVLLSRSRFIAPADHPLRFYQEYFQAATERTLQKDRRRWHIHYQGILFFINVDRVMHPGLPHTFIELKSRTWSAKDAEHKAARIQQMLEILGVLPDAMIPADYLEMEELQD